MLKGKTVVLGVSGSIAAYKIAYLASSLKKLHADVEVILTKNGSEFITPVTFESLTGKKCMVDTFDRNFEFQVEHVSPGEAGGSVSAGAGHGQRHRQNRPRAGGRHADHHVSGLQLSQIHRAGHEHPDVRKSHYPG